MKLNIPRIALITYIALTIVSCSDDEEPVKAENIQEELLKAVNILRSTGCQCGQDIMPPVAALTWNDTLESVALDHARDMYTHNYFSHLSQDGTPPIARAQQAGYAGIYVGENIARGYFNVAAVMEGWKESESHCKNLMDTIYLEAGGASIGGYWVLDFGKRD